MGAFEISYLGLIPWMFEISIFTSNSVDFEILYLGRTSGIFDVQVQFRRFLRFDTKVDSRVF